MTDTEKADLAISLMRRGMGKILDWPYSLTNGVYPFSESQRWLKAKEVLDCIVELVGECGPDTEWYREFSLLTGEHTILTDEGWEPACAYSQEELKTFAIDEVNAPEDKS